MGLTLYSSVPPERPWEIITGCGKTAELDSNPAMALSELPDTSATGGGIGAFSSGDCGGCELGAGTIKRGLSAFDASSGDESAITPSLLPNLAILLAITTPAGELVLILPWLTGEGFNSRRAKST